MKWRDMRDDTDLLKFSNESVRIIIIDNNRVIE